MPARSNSATKKANQEDNALLQSAIDANKINTPKQLLLVVGAVTAFLPAFIAHSVHYIEATYIFNLPLYAVVMGVTAYLLAAAYSSMTEAEFLKRVKHYQEVKESDTKLLKDLRLQASMGYSMFFVNSVFFVVCTLFQVYIFRNSNPYAGFVLSPMLTAAALWILGEKSMDLRKQKMGVAVKANK
eukprot:223162_1